MTETLFNPTARAPIKFGDSANVGQAGQSTVLSGTITLAVATVQAASDALILLGQQSAVRATSGVVVGGEIIEVNSVVPGTGFTLTTADGSATIRPITVNWAIFPLS